MAMKRDPASPRGAARPYRRGTTDALPLVLGYLPFALVLGATIARSEVPNLVGWLSSPLLFAGASQLAAIDLLDAGASVLVILATVWVINLRHVMYSGALAPRFLNSSRRWQWLAPYFLADPVYTLSAVRFDDYPRPADQRRYYLGLGLTLWTAWNLMTGAGLLVGTVLPPSWPLELAVPFTFLALLVPTVTDRPTLLAAAVGGVVAVAAHAAPFHLGLLIGAAAGIGAGLLSEVGLARASGSPRW